MGLQKKGDKKKMLGKGIKWGGKLVLHIVALVILMVFLWMQMKDWVYQDKKAGDVRQFVHYTVYQREHMGLPVTSWDHLWHKGAPRTLDTVWVPHYLVQPVVSWMGLERAVWLFPVAALGGLLWFSYLLFFEVSGSWLVAMGLMVPMVMSKGLHAALTVAGIVTSSISQMFLPAQLYFAARFYYRGGKKNLVAAGVMGALGIYMHGLTMSFFGLLLTGLFILLATKGKEKLISRRTVRNAALFSLTVLTVGGLAFWPAFFHSFTGGAQSAMALGNVSEIRPYLEMWGDIAGMIDVRVWWGLGIGAVVGLVAWVMNRRQKKAGLKRDRLTAYLVLAGFISLWWLSYFYGVNPYFFFFFPLRIFWVIPVIGLLLAAALLRPLSIKLDWKKLLVQLVVFGVLASGALGLVQGLDIRGWKAEFKEWQPVDLVAEAEEKVAMISQLVDLDDWNQRLWTLDSGLNLQWSLVSNTPLTDGYFHFATKQSALWEGWAHGVLSSGGWESQAIPREIIKKQAKFFIDWYGIKFLTGSERKTDFFAISGYFKQKNNPLVGKRISWDEKNLPDDAKGRMVLEIKDEFTSGVMEPVGVTVVGFIGSDGGYRSFLLNLATLGINTSRLVVVRLGGTMSALDNKALAFLDGVVINEQRKGLLDGLGWARLKKFVEEGGKVWIETGGNSIMRAKRSLPAVFPLKRTEFGGLGREWQLTGELAEVVKVESLSPLEFGDDVWQISYAEEDQLREDARVLLAQEGKPIAVERELGQGKVLWSGLNWFYRQEAYRKDGLNEVVPVRIFIERLFGDLEEMSIGAVREFVGPGEARLRGWGLSGVVYKYTKWPGWTAYVEADGKKEKLKIYTAGPELMYVAVPEEMRDKQAEVGFEYKGSAIDWLSLGITMAAIGVVGVYLATGRVVLLKQIKKRFKMKAKKV